MGKQGPCYHCGTTTTPLWRNGPLDKPVLCNACGSRWRTKGTLDNYMPMHSGGLGVGNNASAEMKWSRAKKGFTRLFEQHSNKKKYSCSGYLDSESALWLADPPFSKTFDEEFSNRSSLGSTISISEVSVHHGNGYGAEFPVHKLTAHGLWDTPVPSKKRTTMFRSRASSEKVARSLMAMDEPELSSVTYPSSGTNKAPLVAVKIGLGSVLLRQPLPATQEPESEASSFLIEKTACDISNRYRQGSSGVFISLVNNGKSLPRGNEKGNNIPKWSEAGRMQSGRNFLSNKALIQNFPYNQHNVLQSCQSPLVFLDMKDIVNFDTFTGLLTCQEQAQLMKLLAPVDISNRSLKYMFSSSQFAATFSNFQKLLSEGMFNSSEACQSPRLLQTLTDLTTSRSMEKYSKLQKPTKHGGSAEKLPEFRNCTKDKPKDYNSSIAAISPLTGPKEFESFPGRPPGQALNAEEALRSCAYSSPQVTVSAIRSNSMPKEIHNHNHTVEHLTIGKSSGDSNGHDSGPQSRTYCGFKSVSSPQAHRLSGEFSSNLTSDEQDSGSDLDLLVNIPLNRSFQQAELLQYPSSGKCSYASFDDEFCGPGEAENSSLIMSNTWHMDSASAWDGLI
ncbi:hypothetical protein O6H91_21G044300 [Diphasiastrum complanatum]|uniref:Uncharacterized protein n=1 Tax=Diphasiastrum complanatum TaxID=34168 RepID=A0ACC2AK10_DIPCM|nr:hypothetical protein O6H91_21G044300 [Diphasiastrum complanatum]